MISIIAAMTEERVIGRDGGMPWHIPGDLKLFKELTMGNVVVMGRKTYQSLGKPLKGRLNIVISTRLRGKKEGIEENIAVCSTFDEAIAAARREQRDIFIIGGTEVFRRALPIADRMYISLVKKNYQGDTFFPPFDEEEWKITSVKPGEGFDLAVYERASE